MLKKVSIALALIMLFSIIPGIQNAKADDTKYQTVRVKLSIGDDLTTYSFFLDGNYSIEGSDSIQLERQLYTIKVSNKTLNLYYGSTKIYSADTIKFVRHNPEKENYNDFIWMSREGTNYSYLGDMKFILDSGKYIMAVNYVYIEDYLYGVVGYEMGNSTFWPPEALKAQAVAARSYAENYIDGEGNYDVVDTTASQVYYGYNPSYTRVKAAVDGTANTVVTYNGDVVTTYFGSSNGGYTEIPQHAWGSSKLYPFDVIQEDPYDAANPNCKSETLVFPKAWDQQNDITYKDDNDSSDKGTTEAAAAYAYIKSLVIPAVQAKGYTAYNNVISVNSITPDKNSYDKTSGQRHDLSDYNGNNICPDMLKATMDITVNATRKATSGDIQAAYDTQPTETVQPSDTPSDTVQPTDEPQPTDTPSDTAQPTDTTADTAQPSEGPSDTPQPAATEEPQPAQGIIVSASGTVTEPVTIDITLDLTIFSDSETPGTSKANPYYAFDNHTKNRIYVIEGDGNNWYINHRRFGHGVGLSQYGAQQRALSVDAGGAGQTYDQIMAFYFPNTQLTVQDYTRPSMTDFKVPDHSNAAVDTSSSLNVRSSDSSSAGILGNIPDGARIHVENPDSTSGWYKIIYGGSYAYVSAGSVDIDTPLPPTDSFTLSFETGSGTPVSGVSVNYGDCISKAPVTTRTGYTLEGWYLESDFETKISFPYLVSDNETLYVHWVPTQYTITYNLSPGGTTDNPASYTIESGDIKLNAPIRPNHTFNGWTIAGVSGITQNVTIPAGSMGSRTYTASWTDTQPQTPFLTSLSCDTGTWTGVFSKTSNTSYKVTLDENTAKANIKFMRENDDAAVYVNGSLYTYYQSSIPVSINNGATKTYSIKVKFGSKYHTYTVKVYRNKSTDNYLSNLYATVNGSKVSFNTKGDPDTKVDFNKVTKTYYLHLGEYNSAFKLYDTVEAVGCAKASFTSKTFSVVNGGTTTAKIIVKPQLGLPTTYTVIADRAKSTDSALGSIKTSSSKCKLSPSFSKTHLAYTVTLSSTYSSVTLYFTANGHGAKISVNGVWRTSLKVSLAHGKSLPVTVEVYPQDTSAAPTIYTITVSRP